jgi:hypothetical protein
MEKAKEHNFKGWYVGVEIDTPGKEDLEFGPMSKSAANRKAKELQKEHGDHPWMSPVWMMSGRAMLAHFAEQAERAAGWDPKP